MTTQASIIIPELHPVHFSCSWLWCNTSLSVGSDPASHRWSLWAMDKNVHPTTHTLLQADTSNSPMHVPRCWQRLATASQVLSAIGAVVVMMMTSILGHLVTGIIPSGEGLEGLAKGERTTATASCRCERSLETCHRLFLNCCSLAPETQRMYDRIHLDAHGVQCMVTLSLHPTDTRLQCAWSIAASMLPFALDH